MIAIFPSIQTLTVAEFCILGIFGLNVLESISCAMKTTKLTEYLKTAEAADYLGVSQNTLRKWAAMGAIPMQRNPANGYRLFRRSDLERFLKKAATPVRPR
jgi:excisionase family DNA binding protein